jgi:hypothetical protein
MCKLAGQRLDFIKGGTQNFHLQMMNLLSIKK